MVNMPGGAFGQNYGFQIAEVRSLDDYYKTGRVKVRIYGLQDDEQKVKDENLMEAIPIMDVTSASTGKVGKAPTGLLVGSRVIIGYMSYDFERKTPYIFGSFYRGAKPTDRSQESTEGGRSETDPNSVGIDTPAAANPKTPLGNQAAMNMHNVGLKLNPWNTKDDKYNNARHKDNNSGKEDIKTAREMFAPNADMPTTASADPSKDLAAVLSQVDPMKASITLMQMFSALSLVKSLMNSSSPAPRRKTITDSLSGALCILSKELGFERVIEVMNTALENDGLLIIDEAYRDIVKNALGNLIAKAVEYGPSNIPVSQYPIITYQQSFVILPGAIVDVVPDLYVQQYYPIEGDPYPGYIHYKYENKSVFVRRIPNTPTYTSADEEVYAISETELAEDLRPHFINKDLTAELLNTYLRKQDANVENNGMEKSMGKNAGVNVMGLLSQLLGILGPVINKSLSMHLPVSVLNQGAISQSMEKFSRNMAQIKKMKNDSMPAFALPGGLSSMLGALGGGIGGLAGLAGGLGGLGGALGSVTGALGAVNNLSTITNALGGAGGLGQLASTISNVNNITRNISGITTTGASNVASLVNKIAS